MASRVAELLCILSLLCVVGSECLPHHTQTLGNNSWDYLLFVQRHAPGYCYNQSGVKCFFAPDSALWTIHGLWPTGNNSEGPNCCNNSAVFNNNTIKSLWTLLTERWTDFDKGEQFGSFWKHEYLKHGTCAASLPALNTEYKYFSTVVSQLYERFNFTSVLESADIVPSNTTRYQVTKFDSVFYANFSVKPFLKCSHFEGVGQILTEITLCLDKDFNPRSCSEFVVQNPKGCRSWEQFLYLSSKYQT